VASLIHLNRKAEIGDYVRRTNPEWIVCYPLCDTCTDEYHLNYAGVLTSWVRERYRSAGIWRSRVGGYTRVLLHRRDLEEGAVPKLSAPLPAR